MKSLFRRCFPRLYARLVRVAAAWRRARFQTREVEHIYGSYPLNVWIADAMGESWYDCDWPEMAELTILRQHQLKSGARVFDLGAHHGVVGMMLSRIVGETGCVVVVEADPFCASVARRNQERNGLSQMTVVHAAISDTTGILEVPDDAGAGGSVHRFLDWGDQGVRAMSLDDVTAEYGMPNVVMIDVDGFDCHALRGGAKTIAAKPDFFVEVHVGAGLENEGGTKEEVLAFFPENEWLRAVAGQVEHGKRW